MLLALLVPAGPGSTASPDHQRDISAAVSRLAADSAARTSPPADAGQDQDCKGGNSERQLPFPTISLTQQQPVVATPLVPYAVDPALGPCGARPAPSRLDASSVDLHRLQVLRT